MILAGGMSTRLYPLTKQVPKPLVPVAGEPNAVHVIRYLASHDCHEIAINVHYLADEIVAALGDGSRFGVQLTYLHEKELMGSAGAVKQMEGFLSEGTFAVAGCDDLSDIDLKEVVRFHERKGATATIGLVECADVEQYGVVLLDEDGLITGFQEKPPRGTELSHLANTGIYVFTPTIFDHIPAGVFFDFGKDVFPSLQRARAPFYGFDAKGAYWCDIGTPDEYRRATNDVLSGRFSIPYGRARGIDASAKVSGAARISGDVWIGARVQISDGAAILGPSVIGNDCVVESGAQLERSIVWQNSTVGKDAVLRDSIIGMGYSVPANAILEDAIVANEP